MIIGGRVIRVGGPDSGSESSGSTAPALNNSSSGIFLGLPVLYWIIIAAILIAGGVLIYVFA